MHQNNSSEPVTSQPVSIQHQKWTSTLEYILQKNPSIASGLPRFNLGPSAPKLDDSHDFFDEKEFHWKMGVALRKPEWEEIHINGKPVFSNLSEGNQLLLWNLLRDPEVDFNPHVMDLALQLAETELSRAFEVSSIERFIEFLEFVIVYLMTHPLTPPAPVPVVTQPTYGWMVTSQPKVTPRDPGKTALLSYLVVSNGYNLASAVEVSELDGECCDWGDCDCGEGGDCDFGTWDCEDGLCCLLGCCTD